MENISNISSKISKPKKCYSPSEKAALIESWQRSDLSYREFCARENLSVSSLYKWIKKTSGKENPLKKDMPKSNKFLPVKVVPGDVFDGVVEIKLVNGIGIKFSEQTSIALIGNLIRELQK